MSKMASLPTPPPPPPPPRPHRIVVIGAGCAGLSAARSLTNIPGLTVTVLEGRTRIGGRIDTRTMSNGTSIDMGAAWVNGNSPSNPLTPAALVGDSRSSALQETDWDSSRYFSAVGDVHTAAPSPPLSEQDLKRLEELSEVTWSLFKESQSGKLFTARRGAGIDDDLWATVESLKSSKFPGVKFLSERDQSLLRFAWFERCDLEYAAEPESMSTLFWDADYDQPDDMYMYREGFR